MNDFINNIINNTTFITVLSGVLVYVLSQFVLEGIINPRKKYKQLRERIIYTITLYCCYYHSPYNLLDEKQNVRGKEDYEEASREMRKIGAELAGYIGTIPRIRFKKIKKLKEVLGSIIGISNGFYIVSEKFDIYKANSDCEKVIKKNLKIKD